MATPAPRLSREIPDWLTPRLAWAAGSGWILSACLHVGAATAIVLASQSPGCRATRGERLSDAGAREVGIVLRTPAASQPAPTPTSTEANAASPESTPVHSRPPSPIASAEPPIPLTLPRPAERPVIGRGAPPLGAGLPPTSPASAATGNPAGASSGGAVRSEAGETSLFQVAAKGRRFVYVIDRSSSMDVVLAAAKGELLASLQQLDREQKFQVVFFSNRTTTLKTRFNVFSGTDEDREQVVRQLQDVTADGGTDRLPALLKAYEYNPDVIFFLTDSADPMSARELDDALRKNRSGAQIHCIDFGEGPEPTDASGRPLPNFLQKLAAGSRGRYVYRDARQLAAP
ncbi:MAG: VWA domain-containing protein [Planctomyces sp.]|nr:VWA domain-containing protein [Planctomyces sp.]